MSNSSSAKAQHRRDRIRWRTTKGRDCHELTARGPDRQGRPRSLRPPPAERRNYRRGGDPRLSRPDRPAGRPAGCLPVRGPGPSPGGGAGGGPVAGRGDRPGAADGRPGCGEGPVRGRRHAGNRRLETGRCRPDRPRGPLREDAEAGRLRHPRQDQDGRVRPRRDGHQCGSRHPLEPVGPRRPPPARRVVERIRRRRGVGHDGLRHRIGHRRIGAYPGRLHRHLRPEDNDRRLSDRRRLPHCRRRWTPSARSANAPPTRRSSSRR